MPECNAVLRAGGGLLTRCRCGYTLMAWIYRCTPPTISHGGASS